MQPVAHEPALTERVRDAIVAAIVEGVYRPGERLAQEDLAQRLGVSRQPVSHALNVLKEQGVLIELGRKGLTVAPIEAERLLHLYQVRGRLDALAAGLAAANVGAGRADMQQLRKLEDLLQSQAAAANAGEFAAKVDADVAFHVGVYGLSGNPVIAEMARPQWVHFRRSMQAVLADASSYPAIWRQHRAILDAIKAGDPAEAERLAFDHAEAAATKTVARMQSQEMKSEDVAS